MKRPEIEPNSAAAIPIAVLSNRAKETAIAEIMNICTQAEDKPEDRSQLAKLNECISRMGALENAVFDDEDMYSAFTQMIRELERLRERTYGHLVDWDAIAKGGIK